MEEKASQLNVKKGFWPFRTKKANILLYVAAFTTASVMTFLPKIQYGRDLTRYEAGEIEKKPVREDYGFWNYITSSFSNKKEGLESKVETDN